MFYLSSVDITYKPLEALVYLYAMKPYLDQALLILKYFTVPSLIFCNVTAVAILQQYENLDSSLYWCIVIWVAVEGYGQHVMALIITKTHDNSQQCAQSLVFILAWRLFSPPKQMRLLALHTWRCCGQVSPTL